MYYTVSAIDGAWSPIRSNVLRARHSRWVQNRDVRGPPIMWGGGSADQRLLDGVDSSSDAPGLTMPGRRNGRALGVEHLLE